MSNSIPGNTGKVKNRSYQDLAKENAVMLEALKLARKVTFEFEELHIYQAINKAIAKAEGK